MMLYKAKDGGLWFIGIYSNNFEDREQEILSEASHKEYISWLNETGVKPPIVVFHQPKYPKLVHLAHYMQLASGDITVDEYNDDLLQLYKATAFAQTERVMLVNGFAIVIAKVFNNKIPALQLLSEREKAWSMSHGFIVVKNDDNIIEGYRTFEFSVLPEKYAANSFTPITIGDKQMGEMLSDQDRKWLADHGIDGSEWETGTSKAKQILSRLFNSKEVDVATEEEAVAETPVEGSGEDVETTDVEPTEDVVVAKVFAALDVEGMQNAFVQAKELIDNLTAKVAELEQRMTAQEKSEDDKIASMYVPSWGTIFNKTGVEDQELVDDLKKDIPPGVVDDKSKGSNPLDLGLWNMFGN